MKDSSDVLDQATDQEMAFRDAAIAAATRKRTPPKEFNGQDCTECEDNIPKGRLDLGYWTCIACQSDMEKSNKGRKP